MYDNTFSKINAVNDVTVSVQRVSYSSNSSAAFDASNPSYVNISDVVLSEVTSDYWNAAKYTYLCYNLFVSKDYEAENVEVINDYLHRYDLDYFYVEPDPYE